MEYYLAVDIGASSGRHILGSLVDGRIEIEEIHRFTNHMIKKHGHWCWDVEYLFEEIVKGLRKCKECGKIPISMGIDTWAVDYVLLDKYGELIGDVYGYRDSRTDGIDEVVYQKISPKELYGKTGIQKQIFNTIYQLYAAKEQMPEVIEEAESMLMIPDYFNYRLTDIAMTEYTNASTTQLVNEHTKNWDFELIDTLGLKRSLFGKIYVPGTSVGMFSEKMKKEVGFSCEVILPATHDTGSAVMSVPCDKEQFVYISSGTWSLMGTELLKADTSMEAMNTNFTNEGGYEYRFRYLKNIMGLWMIQSMKEEIANEYSFEQICDMASKEKIESIVDCNDHRFMAPDNMTQEVQNFCMETNQRIPMTVGQVAAVIYNSLATCYAKTLKEIEQLTKHQYAELYIVGGGSNAEYLNKLTAKFTGKTVYAGPSEATAIGNIMTQLIKDKKLVDLSEARKCVRHSFIIKKSK